MRRLPARDQNSVSEAVEEYLGCEMSDSSGQLLLSEVEELLAAGMSEEQLTKVIENTWEAPDSSAQIGLEYVDILEQVRNDLKRRQAK